MHCLSLHLCRCLFWPGCELDGSCIKGYTQVLIAGGGTGDATVEIVQFLTDLGCTTCEVYLGCTSCEVVQTHCASLPVSFPLSHWSTLRSHSHWSTLRSHSHWFTGSLSSHHISLLLYPPGISPRYDTYLPVPPPLAHCCSCRSSILILLNGQFKYVRRD